MNNEMQMVHVQDAFVPENIEVAPPDGGGGGNPLAKVHQCLRGRYLKAITTGILLGAIGASVAYFLVPLKYTSIGQIHIRQGLERVLPSSGENTISNYESFVQTQARTRYTLKVAHSALR